MGEIFLAKPSGGGGYVAVKRLAPHMADDATFVGMFLDEARLSPLLQHPNICRVFELGQEGDSYFLAMEWIEGASLRLLLTRGQAQHGNLPVGVVCWIIAEVARGLDYAHRLTDGAGTPYCIVHRDVSPKNIMIGYDGDVKLLDFGMAKARTQLHQTQPGHVKGKFGYLAPEQLSGDVDARTDVFALALCLYEALCGEPVFDHKSAAETVRAVRAYEQPPSVRVKRPDVPRGIDGVIRRALAPDPGERFQSAAGLQLAIERVLREEGLFTDEAEVGAYLRELFPEHARAPKQAGYSQRPPSTAPRPAVSAPPVAPAQAVPTGGAAQPSGPGEAEAELLQSSRRMRPGWIALGTTVAVAIAAIVIGLLAR